MTKREGQTVLPHKRTGHEAFCKGYRDLSGHGHAGLVVGGETSLLVVNLELRLGTSWPNWRTSVIHEIPAIPC